MAVPTKYNPSYSYTGFESDNPASPKPGAQLDNDFADISQSLDETIDALSEIRRSDGALANGVVTPDSLSAGLVMGFTVEGQWTDGAVYDAADGVTYGTSFYKARVGHTAAPATRPDLSPATWAFLFTFDSIAVGDNAVTTAKIADGAVTAAKLASDAVTTVKILDANVTTAKIADTAVTAAKLGASAVTTINILDANVTTAKLADAAITGVKLADASVDTAKIVDAAVTFAKMASAALTSIYAAARSNMLALANTWTGTQTISTNALDLAVGQIKFPATQNASSDANTLDDYEEGTWTPAFSATGCTFNYAANGQIGTYTKIGNRVFCDFRLSLATSGNTLAANTLTVTGFPFACGTQYPAGSNICFRLAWAYASASFVDVSGTLQPSATAMNVCGNTAAAINNATNLSASAILSATLGSQVKGSALHYAV